MYGIRIYFVMVVYRAADFLLLHILQRICQLFVMIAFHIH